MDARKMLAKFPGKCAGCSTRFATGEEIAYAYREKKAYCLACSGGSVESRPAGGPRRSDEEQPQQARLDGVGLPEGAQPIATGAIATGAITLDEDQAAVCAWRKGEAVAAAAAGSGKSTVLVERTAELLREGNLPESILLLCFGRDAAKSLRERLAARLGEAVAARVRASTYHAFALAVLRRAFSDDPSFRQIVGTDEAPSKRSLIGKALRDLGVDGEAEAYADLDERLRESGIDLQASDAVDQVERSRWAGGSYAVADRIVRVSRAYREQKRNRRCVDFTDLLCRVAQECRTDSPLARAMACYAHVMVDEAQDTNVVQQQIGLYLGSRAQSLLWVGDLRQSIYGWRGAEPQRLQQRIEAGAALLPIRTCRRSSAAIVEAGNAVARGRTWHLGGDSRPRPDAPHGARPVARRGGPADIADAIKSAVDGLGSSRDHMVLARTRATLADIECALVARGLPVRMLGSRGGVWDTQIGRAIRGYLHAAAGRCSEFLGYIGNRPLRFVRNQDLEAAEQECRRGRSLPDALRAQGHRGSERLAYDLSRLARLDYSERCQQIGDWLQQDAEERAAGLKIEVDEDKVETIRTLCSGASELGSVEAIEEQVAALKRAPEDAPAVVIGTCHGAKGLEARHVYVAAADDTAFPHRKALTEEEVEEERRLWYVATSRAIESLTYYVSNEPSPFFAEMGEAVECAWDVTEPTPVVVLSAEGAEALAEALDRPAAPTAALVALMSGSSGADAPDDPLAGPTPTEEEIGPDEPPAPGERYVPVRLAALRALLEPQGWRGAVAAVGNQYVFWRPSTAAPGTRLQLYTSIPVGQTVAAEVGEDSIRVVALDEQTQRPVLPRQAWVQRTVGWRESIKRRLDEVESTLAATPVCGRCGALTREIKRRDGSGTFRGCVRFPNCRSE